jgi:deoxyhypusine synthase
MKPLKAVKGYNIRENITAKELVKQMRDVGFQATQLGEAVKILRKMRKEQATIFLTFTSNMVSSGLRELFAYLVEKKSVHVVITSVGSIEEDFIKSEKSFLLGDFHANDADLEKEGINRIGNIFVPNDRYEFLENKVQGIFEEMYEEKKIWAPHELARRLGEKVDDKSSFLYWATRNEIPIFCQAVTDGAIGLQLYFFKQKHKDFVIDTTAEEKLAEITLGAKKTGGIILGGGVAKHHAIGVNILRGGFDYAVYVTTSTEYDGSLSGARTNEAISWNKIKRGEGKNHVTVEGDATIIFPLMVVGWLEED